MYHGREIMRIFAVIVMCAVFATAAANCSPGGEKEKMAGGSPIVQSTVEDFGKGAGEGTEITNLKGGEIVLSKKDGRFPMEGVFTSQAIYTGEFQNMLLSCNSDTPEGTTVKVEVQVMAGGKWSRWLNWGTWGAYVRSGSNISKEQDEIASMEEDVLFVKDAEKAAKAIRYRVTLNTSDGSVTPAVRSVIMSLRNNTKPITKNIEASDGQDNSSFGPGSGKVLEVPAFSQTIRDKAIAMNICSPTCISMVLRYYGIELLPEECAWGVYDHYAMLFGNWAFNCAYVGSYGIEAYTDYCSSIDDIRREIANGYPVIASVRYKNNEAVEGDLPVLHGAPIDRTEGHLVVVCGFTHEDEKEYLVVNDPAAKDDKAVRVKYAADEFEKAWFKVVYIIHGDKAVSQSPRRQTAEFAPTGNKRQSMTGDSCEYRLKSGGGEIDMSRDNIKTIMYTFDGENYEYVTPASDKTFWFSRDKDKKKYSFIIIASDRSVFTADIK